MAVRFRQPGILEADSLRSFLKPWLHQNTISAAYLSKEARFDDLVRAQKAAKEARLVLQILDYVEAVADCDEIRRTFRETPLEAHLAESLLSGGAAGDIDMPRLLQSLQGAIAAGSMWAPQWLATLERHGLIHDEHEANTLFQLCQLVTGMAKLEEPVSVQDSLEAIRSSKLQADFEEEELIMGSPAANEAAAASEKLEEMSHLPRKLSRLIEGFRAMEEATGDSKEQQERDIMTCFVLKPRKSRL
eukprot:TRINITY_DN3872_c0_g2_i1.p1 TRINITY_DN3872_c0_g2~~TRINITY_DN3872_c0_g2_i1.p1  ORF type:complete len:246 (-),score=57.91 TRINITY_DN3872_c0_g2_i1:350-1087(-)